MSKDDIFSFIEYVEAIAVDVNANPFMIKKINDFNGTHRILYKKHSLGRSVDNFSPLNISDGASQGTIIADVVITGSQICDAFEYYLYGKKAGKHSNYFEFDPSMAEKLKSLTILNICSALYVSGSRENISKVLNDKLGMNVTVNFVHGSDIGKDAFFGTTARIGEVDKSMIRSLLKNESLMRMLYNTLNVSGRFNAKVYTNDKDIDNTNLVARYQSLPKKCFKFLHAGLRHDNDCYPFVRILELNE